MKETELDTLQNRDPEDIEDALACVQSSLGVKYAPDAFADVKTFGEMCDVIIATVDAEDAADCTSQQAFYKLRRAIVEVLTSDAVAGVPGADAREILPATSMDELFPRKGRRRKIRQLRKVSGVKLDLIEPKGWVSLVLVLSFLFSFVYLFIQWRYGLLGLLTSFLGNWVARWTANELCYGTVGEVVRSFVESHYRLARRQPGTMNRREIVPLVKAIFREKLVLEPEVLVRDAKIF
jgi:hypothetical protein